jgi:1,2-diacylglycerol 3-beta-galactosyltransferase
MILNPPDPPRILFLFSDTGGGHRSAAEAIIEAVHKELGERISTQMVDIIKAYAPRPLNRMPALYPQMVRTELWGLGYHLTDNQTQSACSPIPPGLSSAARCAA